MEIPKQDPSELLNSYKMTEIADQVCEFIMNYNITINEARMIAGLVPTLINEMITRIPIKSDGSIDDSQEAKGYE